MVQLHYTRDSVRSRLQSARLELSDEYYIVLLELYESLESDPEINSAATLKSYIDKAVCFLRWLMQNNITVEQLDREVLRKYMYFLRVEKSLKPGALQVHIRTLKRLLRTLGKEDLAKLLKYPRTPVKHYELPRPEQVERIIAETRNLTYKTIIALLYETGARVSEILSLRLKHVKEAPEGYYRLTIEDAKNGEFRHVYVIKYASLLREYLNQLGPRSPEDHLFPSPTRPGEPLHPRNVERVLRIYGEKHGVRLHPHLLRHLRATLLVKERMHERIIMKLLGHRSEKMMRIYVNLAGRDVEETILEHYGVRKLEETPETKKCPRCGAMNLGEAMYCWRCGAPLTTIAARHRDALREKLEDKIRRVLEILRKNPELIEQL